MKRIFIVNPISGLGKSLEISKKIKDICDDDKLDYELFYTLKSGDAYDISKSYKYIPNQIIYSIGGDGTLNEIVNGIVNSNNSLTIIPSGTGNDFFRNKIESDKIDIGLVNDRYFINVASIGMDADVASLANKYKLEHKNGNVYLHAAFNTLMNYKEPIVNINNEDKVLNILAVCNGRYYGNGIMISPESILNDGELNICLVTNLKSKINKAYVFSKLLKSNHIGHRNVDYYKSNHLVLSSSIPLICNVDGEIIKDNRYDFSIIKNGLNIRKEDNPKIKNLIKSLI